MNFDVFSGHAHGCLVIPFKHNSQTGSGLGLFGLLLMIKTSHLSPPA